MTEKKVVYCGCLKDEIVEMLEDGSLYLRTSEARARADAEDIGEPGNIISIYRVTIEEIDTLSVQGEIE